MTTRNPRFFTTFLLLLGFFGAFDNAMRLSGDVSSMNSRATPTRNGNAGADKGLSLGGSNAWVQPGQIGYTLMRLRDLVGGN
ncbi:hypothetical protein N7456_010328 [Penicillium angulare]|uniref:Secreted protein n=1 Tax=Penicillium angulare TaxID=116970 RepID=A0A9W9F6H3_9EURO|nr:hypothetical protein N7456_010328 [Penicillium angulare]